MRKLAVAALIMLCIVGSLFANGANEKSSNSGVVEFKVVGNNSSALVTEAMKNIAA